MIIFKKAIYETGDNWSMNQIYFVGYDGQHKSNFKYDIPEGYNCYLLILTQTPALFLDGDRAREYPAHTAILYPPNCRIWYAASGDSYENCWLRFASDESFVTNFPQQSVPFSVSDPQYCRNLFQLLTWEASHLPSSLRHYKNTGISTQNREGHSAHDASEDSRSDLTVSQLLRILFDKLHDDVLHHEAGCHDHALLALRRQIHSNPQLPWSVDGMAAQLHISTGYLQLLYKQKFNAPCMEDVIRFRICKAKDLLSYTNLSAAEIAGLCGYNNAEHFCRHFRKYTSLTPGEFRLKRHSKS